MPDQRKLDEIYNILNGIYEGIPVSSMEMDTTVNEQVKFDPTGLRSRLDRLARNVDLMLGSPNSQRGGTSEDEMIDELLQISKDLQALQPESNIVGGTATFQNIELTFKQDKFFEQMDQVKGKIDSLLAKPNPEVEALQAKVKAAREKIETVSKGLQTLAA